MALGAGLIGAGSTVVYSFFVPPVSIPGAVAVGAFTYLGTYYWCYYVK